MSSSPCPGAQQQARGRCPEKLADLSKVMVLVASRVEQKARTSMPGSLCQGLFLGNTPVTFQGFPKTQHSFCPVP